MICTKPCAQIRVADHGYSGSTDDLAVTVTKFVPKVVCSARPYPHDSAVVDACEVIVDQMDTSNQERIFAQRSIHEPNLETPLPAYYTAPAQGSTRPPPQISEALRHKSLTVNSKGPKCVLRVTGSLPRQFGNWYIIWEATAAIAAMCIRQGKGGYWDGLGRSNSFVPKLKKLQLLIFC